MVIISRPSADTASTSYWFPNTGLDKYSNINETSYNDTNYIFKDLYSPISTETFDLDNSIPVGIHSLRFRIKTEYAWTGKFRIKFLDNSNVIVGQSSWNVPTTTYSTIIENVSISDIATKIEIEIDTQAVASFISADGTNITGYISDTNDIFNLCSWNLGDTPTIQSNRLNFGNAQNIPKAIYLNKALNSSDYSTRIVHILPASSVSGERLMAGVRLSSSSKTGYFGGGYDASQVVLGKWISGTWTQLGSTICTAISNSIFIYECEAVGSTISLYVQRAIDNYWLVGPNTYNATKTAAISVTDTSIPSIGYSGLWAEQISTSGNSVIAKDYICWIN